MGKEIERKFLVNHQRWAEADKTEGCLFRQGYLSTDPHKTIRVRVEGDAATLTIKGLTTGASRSEFEYAIPVNDAVELLEQFAETELSKIRFDLEYASKHWEVDVFLGDNQGLIVAEIELESETETFELPDWIDCEVTDDPRYYNANLSLMPFSKWDKM
ncbi:MAG TPA: adenylate cyclase [Saprospirales bacterium]|nr:adenylate cyclase [Saprospirales bacterium]